METKLVNSLPTSKFYRLEHDSNGRCILLYIGHEIPLRLQRVYKINNNPGFCSIEVNIRKKKWLRNSQLARKKCL